jgi:exodeoxyribonuclease III
VRIVTLNLNGIRSAVNKGFLAWLATQSADVVCVQELKAQDKDLTDAIRNPDGYTGYFHCADRPGYSGVGIYSRKKPERLIAGVGIPDIDAEGRYLEAQFGNLSIVSLYVPSGSSSAERLAIKFSFMHRCIDPLHKLGNCGREIVICGDWNVAHKEIDLKNWRSKPEKTPAFCRRNVSGSPESSSIWATSTSFAGSTTVPNNIPGGPAAARRGRKTSAGALTISLPPRASPARQRQLRSTRPSAFPTTRQ